MAKDNAQSSFQRGVMSLLILSLLDQEDMYGYQIVQEIAARSGGTIVTQEGSLYLKCPQRIMRFPASESVFAIF